MNRTTVHTQGAPYQPAFSATGFAAASSVLPSENPLPNSTMPEVESAVLQWVMSFIGDDDDGDDLKRWSSFIGIIVAIGGNVLISLALNIQKYAHIRLRREKSQRLLQARRRRKERAWKRALPLNGAAGRQREGQRSLEDDNDDDDDDDDDLEGMGQLDGDETPEEDDGESQDEDSNLMEGNKARPKPKDEDDKMYLHSPWWWMGLVLMFFGECGNFLAYGFAPASIVSPLGVVALISNCLIAPLMLKEPFRTRDFLGVLVSISGAVIVVLSSAPEEVKLGPDQIIDAISQIAFLVYFCVTCVMIATLMYMSHAYGSKLILIDLGLVALFGGYTVLSTKGISSLLSSSLYHIFTMPIAYLFGGVLVSTAILQIKYINRALQRFDSTQVIPTQFVLFTLSVIIGSAILYRDFEKITQDRLTKFILGCGLTFWGVYLITSGRVSKEDEDDDQGLEEGDIGLREGDVTSASEEGGSRASSIANRRRRGLAFGSDGSASPRVSRSDLRNSLRPVVQRYQSSHSAAITETSLDIHEDYFTEASPLLEQHPDLDSPPPSPRFAGGTSSVENTPSHRHSISLIPGPIVLGIQLQAAVVDHVGPPIRELRDGGAKRISRKIRHKKSASGIMKGSLDGDVTGEASMASSYSYTKVVSRALKEPEDAGSGGEDMAAEDGTGKTTRARSSSLQQNLALDVIPGKKRNVGAEGDEER